MKKMESGSYGLTRQREIYLGGMAGKKPRIPLQFDDLEQAARQALPGRSFHYIATGAGDGKAVIGNTNAFKNWSFVPRMLRNVEDNKMDTSFAGVKLSCPLMLAPVGVLSLAHPDADIGVAKAANSLGIPMIFSNQASVPMEDTSACFEQTPYWFQLYWSRSMDLVRSFVERAEKSGCAGIVVTLDTTMLGWRPRDLEQAFLPFLHGKGLAQYLSDPVFHELIMAEDRDKENAPESRTPVTPTTIYNAIRLLTSFPGGLLKNIRSGYPLKAVRLFTRIYTNPGLQWSDLKKLREITKLPIILKGILHPDDAQRAVAEGIDGLIISNHGGRQVEGAVAPLMQLPLIREKTGPDLPIALDSGVRTGADIMKAIRLGADAVCIGRPYAYALALGGRAGVEEYLRNLLADLDLTMRLSGCCNLDDIRELEIIRTHGS